MFYNQKILTPTVNTSFSCSFNPLDVVTTSRPNLNWLHFFFHVLKILSFDLASLYLD